MEPQYIAVPKKTQPLDYKKIEYVASHAKENENGDIEQPKYVSNAMQAGVNFTGDPML
jgi:hypothetical protein